MIEETNPFNRYKSKSKIHLFQIESTKPDYSFLPPDHNHLTEIIHGKKPLQEILSHVHSKFDDDGLINTLIHKIYDCSDVQIQFYVPELVYMGVQKKSKPIRKLLIFKASKCENLRRLILWNLKAFTVLMKQRDQELRKYCTFLEEEITSTISNKGQFNFSEKAIAMLTTGSLLLKKMPKENLKARLKTFIKKFNKQILNTLNHNIIVPFRRKEKDKWNSTYVVRVIEDNCSCFPTRKRVPYRIIIQSIDTKELQSKQPHRSFFTKNPVEDDHERDLYNEVKEEVEKMAEFEKSKWMLKDTVSQGYPYVRDDKEIVNITQLTRYAKDIEIKEKEKQKESTIGYKMKQRVKKMGSRIIPLFSDKGSESSEKRIEKEFFQLDLNQNEQLQKFNATYIPTLPSTDRKSGTEIYSKEFHSNKKINEKARWSDASEKEKQSNIKIIEEEPKWSGPSVWGETWEQTQKSLKTKSSFNKFESLTYRNVVIKGGDDLRQQIICMQLIYKMESILLNSGVDAFIKPYEIIVLSENSGLLEFVPNSISIDGLKKQKDMNLKQFYHENFQSETAFRTAKSKFVKSLAGSSIITYILLLKDRHNGNILIDNEGSIIHIDFGFILGMSPGGLNFESSPFKLTEEYVELMGGKNSPDYNYFRHLFCEGMLAIRRRLDDLCLLLEIMMDNSDLDCFQNFRIDQFRERFRTEESESRFRDVCEALVEKSCMNTRTVHYDIFQKVTNNIMP